jgi:hypothetical protein
MLRMRLRGRVTCIAQGKRRLEYSELLKSFVPLSPQTYIVVPDFLSY